MNAATAIKLAAARKSDAFYAPTTPAEWTADGWSAVLSGFKALVGGDLEAASRCEGVARRSYHKSIAPAFGTEDVRFRNGDDDLIDAVATLKRAVSVTRLAA